jgi:large subunit ribosomal protein L3
VSLGLIGRKVGMGHVYAADGTMVPITIVEAGPCPVVQIKSKGKEGYNALQLGFLPKKAGRVNKPLQGHCKKSGAGTLYYLREFRVDDVEPYQLGQAINVEIFSVGQKVRVTGVSRGMGFAGGVKRWKFRGGPGTHGSTSHRAPGSIGSSAFPSRVFKGQRLPGHMGTDTVTVDGLVIVDQQPGRNLLFIRGAVPGCKNGMLIIKPSQKQPTGKAVKP